MAVSATYGGISQQSSGKIGFAQQVYALNMAVLNDTEVRVSAVLNGINKLGENLWTKGENGKFGWQVGDNNQDTRETMERLVNVLGDANKKFNNGEHRGKYFDLKVKIEAALAKNESSNNYQLPTDTLPDWVALSPNAKEVLKNAATHAKKFTESLEKRLLGVNNLLQSRADAQSKQFQRTLNDAIELSRQN